MGNHKTLPFFANMDRLVSTLALLPLALCTQSSHDAMQSSSFTFVLAAESTNLIIVSD